MYKQIRNINNQICFFFINIEDGFEQLKKSNMKVVFERLIYFFWLIVL
jgi:hypothetical protein